MVKIPVALQLYTVREAMALDPAATLAKVRACGYTNVELAGLQGMTPQAYRRLLDAQALTAMSMHVGLDDLQDPLHLADTAHELGVQYVVLAWLPESHRGDPQAWQAIGRRLAAVATALQDEGLGFCYHNHDFEFTRSNGTTGLEWMLSAACDDRLFCELDLYWVKAAGEDPLSWIRKLGSRVRILHLKDMAPDGFFAEVGSGSIDWPSILRAAAPFGVAWAVVEQDQSRLDPLESIAISYRYLAQLGVVPGDPNESI